MRKWLVLGLLALACAAGGWGIQTGRIDLDRVAELLPQKGGASAKPTVGESEAVKRVSVEAAEVKLGAISTTVSALGTLQASQSVTIQPEIAGKVARVGFREGDRVKAGDVLIELDQSILGAELDQAKTMLELADVNYRRADTLAKQGIGTARLRDEGSATFQNARTAVELAKARLQKTVIAAPFAGVIGLSDVTVGRFLNVGDRIVNLEAIDPLKVDFRVPELLLGSVRVGQPVSIAVDAFPEKPFVGEVYAIDPLVDVEGRAVRLRARVANPDGALRPGLFARVRLTIDRRQNAMLVPESALVPQGQDRFVYLIEDDTVTFTKVATGERNAGEVEITSGLKPGDRIVSGGQLKLFDGAAVEIRPAAGKASRD
jgi:membrane fusion protein (multidrug efflux system)